TGWTRSVAGWRSTLRQAVGPGSGVPSRPPPPSRQPPDLSAAGALGPGFGQAVGQELRLRDVGGGAALRGFGAVLRRLVGREQEDHHRLGFPEDLASRL